MNLVNLKTFKLARQYAKDSKTILKIIDLAIRGLQAYTYYKPVADVLECLKSNKTVLEAHANTASKMTKKDVT